jgi:hypothetical protein
VTSEDSDDVNRSRLRWMLGVLALVAIPLTIIWWPGCRQYPPVRSRESLELIKLLYTACNTKDPVRLARAEQSVQKLKQDGKLSDDEDEAFTRIIRMAKAGEWAKAEKAAFRFAQDQIGAGDANSHSGK